MEILNTFVAIILALILILIVTLVILKIISVAKYNTMYKNVTLLLKNISIELKKDLDLEKEIKKENELNKPEKKNTKKKKHDLFDELDINFDLEKEDDSINYDVKDLFKVTRISKKNNCSELYDFKMVLNNKIIFIKIVPNFSNAEICMNNATKWQVRKSFDDNKENYLDIEDFVRFDPRKEIKVEKSAKLALIYPNANSILRYVNECEMKFVTPKTDLNGLFAMTYQELKNNYKDIKCEGKKNIG